MRNRGFSITVVWCCSKMLVLDFGFGVRGSISWHHSTVLIDVRSSTAHFFGFCLAIKYGSAIVC